MLDGEYSVSAEPNWQRQGLRLIELPPELVKLVEEGGELGIRSINPVENAYLCTDTNTYAIRTVQSSNSVFVAEKEGEQLKVMSNSAGVLEVSGYNIDEREVLEQIPYYRSRNVDPSKHMTFAGDGMYSMEETRDLIPVSNLQWARMRTKHMIFEMEESEFTYKVPPELAFYVLTYVWQECQATGQSASLLHKEFIRQLDLGEPKAVVYAVMEAFSSPSGDDVWALDGQYCTLWTGTYLASLHEQNFTADELLEEWRAALTEEFHHHLHMDLLRVSSNEINANASTRCCRLAID